MRLLLNVWLLFLLVSVAGAHDTPSSAVLLKFHGSGVDAELRLPASELEAGLGKIFPADPTDIIQKFGPEIKTYVLDHTEAMSPDGKPWTVGVVDVKPSDDEVPEVWVELKLTPPPGAAADKLTLAYDVIIDKLSSHSTLVMVASDWRNGVLDGDEHGTPELLGTLSKDQRALEIDRSKGAWFKGFAAMFQLGAKHIGEGTDHLLFLLALLLPAPLLARGRKWEGFAGGKLAFVRIAKVVSAFTIGHSITLIIGALGWNPVPSSIIESAIAVSIFVSAVHVVVPIFAGKEVYIAGGFGLVHGLAFAGTLTEFGFDPWTMVSSVLGFNLGIEAIQLLVIVAAMPWLVLLARTKVYNPMRVSGAVVTAIAAATWFFERALGWPNPLEVYVEQAAGHALWLVIGLAVLAVLVNVGWLGKRLRVSPAAAG